MDVIAYKGMKSDMTWIDFQYEIGKTYKTDSVELCKFGFHAYLNPIEVLGYYSQEGSRYYKVKVSGEIAKCDFYNTKVTATEITILEEITDTFNEVIETTEWWKNENVIDLLYFSDGFAKVQRGDGLWNFIDKQGKILSEQWFEWVCNFYDEFARVQRSTDDLWNFIDRQGKLLSDEWFIDAYYLDDGFAKVKRTNGEWCNIDKTGKLHED